VILNIAKHESIGGIQNGVYYCNLPNYPELSLVELKAHLISRTKVLRTGKSKR